MKNGNSLMDTELEKVSGGAGTGGRYEKAIKKLDSVLLLIDQYKAEPGADESVASMLSEYCKRIRTALTDNYREEADFQLNKVMQVLGNHIGGSQSLQEAYTILTVLYI